MTRVVEQGEQEERIDCIKKDLVNSFARESTRRDWGDTGDTSRRIRYLQTMALLWHHNNKVPGKYYTIASPEVT